MKTIIIVNVIGLAIQTGLFSWAVSNDKTTTIILTTFFMIVNVACIVYALTKLT